MAATVISVVSSCMVTPSLKIEKPPDLKSGGGGWGGKTNFVACLDFYAADKIHGRID